MAWSPQARAAAIAARKARAHGPKISMTGHHGIRGGKTQPVNQAGHRGIHISPQTKQKIKSGAKTAAVAGGVVAYVAATQALKSQHARRISASNSARAAKNASAIKSAYNRGNKSYASYRPATRGHVTAGPPNKHNRVFATNSYGKTSVRKKVS